jgi:hypothetical protein
VVLQVILEDSGKQFEPRVVEALAAYLIRHELVRADFVRADHVRAKGSSHVVA